MLEIKFIKSNKEQKTKKKETSKKLAWFSGICFIASLIYGMISFAYGTIFGTIYDYTLPVTLITVTGAVFGTVCAFYNNKARYENVTKIQRSFLKTKYLMLKDIGLLDEYRVQMELDNELSKIDSDIENEKMIANSENTYNG